MGEEVEGALQDLGLTGNKIGNLGGPSPHHVSLFVVLVSFSNCDFYWWVLGYQNFTTRDAAAAVGLGLPVLPILPMRRHTYAAWLVECLRRAPPDCSVRNRLRQGGKLTA